MLVDDNETHLEKNEGNCVPIRSMDILDLEQDLELRYLTMLLEHLDMQEHVQPFLRTLLGHQ